jgi:hypothetical protein
VTEALLSELDRYASLEAELAAAGEAPLVLARYALDGPAHDRLRAHWRGRFREEPALERDFDRLVSHQRRRRAGMTSAPPPPPDPGPLAARARGPVRLDQTMDDIGFRRPAVPFRTGPSSPSPVGHRVTPLPRAAPREQGDEPETEVLVAFTGGAPLPFKGAAVAARAREAAAPPRAREVAEEPTAVLEDGSPLAAALPFQERGESADVRVVPLALEQHASLSVELALAPERSEEILRRYGQTAASKAALDERHAADCAADPALAAAWRQALETYRAYLTRPR